MSSIYLVNLDKNLVVARFADMDSLTAIADKANYDYTEVDCEDDLLKPNFNLAALAAMFNNIGDNEVKKFGSKAVGAKRVFAAMEAAEFTPAKARPSKGEDAILVQPMDEKVAYREGTKFAKLVEALGKEEGSTMAELAEVTGWKEATVMAYFYYDVKRKGYGVARKAHDDAPMTFHLIN